MKKDKKEKTPEVPAITESVKWYSLTSTRVDNTIKLKIVGYSSPAEAMSKKRTPSIIVPQENVLEALLGLLPKDLILKANIKLS